MTNQETERLDSFLPNFSAGTSLGYVFGGSAFHSYGFENNAVTFSAFSASALLGVIGLGLFLISNADVRLKPVFKGVLTGSFIAAGTYAISNTENFPNLPHPLQQKTPTGPPCRRGVCLV